MTGANSCSGGLGSGLARIAASRPVKRAVTATLLLTLFLLYLVLFPLQPESKNIPAFTSTTPSIPRCNVSNQTLLTERWSILKSKHDHLVNDKFTVVISTFHRPKELSQVLDALLRDPIASLAEVVVVWNNFEETPPKPFVSSHGVNVRYRVPEKDSLNTKLFPDPAFKTQAVLLSDDDVFYQSRDLEFVFQTWRKFGQNRLTGALARCSILDKDNNTWKYDACSTKTPYSMVLTNLAFVHIGFLEAYFSDNEVVTKIRQHVDDKFNCEDIALNFVASQLSGIGPLLVRGHDQYVSLGPTKGISRNPSHAATRSNCLNVFADIIGCMPLIDEEGRIERGVKHNIWYKTFADRIWA